MIYDLAAVGYHVLVLFDHGLSDAVIGLVQALLRLRHDLDVLRVRVGDLSCVWRRHSLVGCVEFLTLLGRHLRAADVASSMVPAHERGILFLGRVTGVQIFLALMAQVVACVAPANATIVYCAHRAGFGRRSFLAAART